MVIDAEYLEEPEKAFTIKLDKFRTVFLSGVELGYKLAEKGVNIQAALQTANKMYDNT